MPADWISTPAERAALRELGPTRPATGMQEWAEARIRKATRAVRGSNEFVRISRLPGDVVLRARNARTAVMYVPHNAVERNAIVVCGPAEWIDEGTVRVVPEDTGLAFDITADGWGGDGRNVVGQHPVTVAVRFGDGAA